MLRLAVDVDSGDNPREELIKGCLDAFEFAKDVKIVLVGDKGAIMEVLSHHDLSKLKDRLIVEHAPQIVEMNEQPAVACRKKPDSTVMVGVSLLKAGFVDAFFSPGNTGATLTASLYVLGRIKGVSRPALAIFVPNKKGTFSLMLDGGANMDCVPKYLRQFAIMGAEYYKMFFNVEKPTIGILNIGEEEGKGNEMAIATHKLLKELPYSFFGNIEPLVVFEGNCNVVVADGFVGNVYLKTLEASASLLFGEIKAITKKGWFPKLALLSVRKYFKAISDKFNPKEIGCAPLIGVDGSVFIGHGSSNATSVKGAIYTILQCIEKNPIEVIRRSIKNYG